MCMVMCRKMCLPAARSRHICRGMSYQLYRHFDRDGTLLYVRISLSALRRLGDHAQTSGWFSAIKRVEIETFPDRAAAVAAERAAIRDECLLYNVAGSSGDETPETRAAKKKIEQRARQSAVMKKRWQDPDFRENHAAGIAARRGDFGPYKKIWTRGIQNCNAQVEALTNGRTRGGG
jgi:hypothetical protein